jgi:hypothetical protein
MPFVAGGLFGLLFYPEDGRIMFLRRIGEPSVVPLPMVVATCTYDVQYDKQLFSCRSAM